MIIVATVSGSGNGTSFYMQDLIKCFIVILTVGFIMTAHNNCDTTFFMK